MQNFLQIRQFPGRKPLLFWLTSLALCILPESQNAATNVAVRDVTFFFSADHTVGQYANGDWWVLGPVNITHITPESTNANGWWQHGTQLNATAGTGPQGFDSSMTEGGQGPGYSSILNVDPGHTTEPLAVQEGTIIKAISLPTRPSTRGAGRRPQLKGMEYLTVVATLPPTGAFRPPPVGTDKTSLWTVSQLDFSILRNLRTLSGAPTKKTAENWYLRPWPSFIMDNQGRWIHPTGNMPEYGRDLGRRLGQGGLVLHSDIGDKTTLYIRLVQIGIDTYATVQGNRFFAGFGAINCGWKWPVLLAGLALRDEEILYQASGGVTTPGSAPNSNRLNFAFDRQTWYVQENDVDRVMYSADGRPRDTYDASHVGLPEWGEQHWKQKQRDGSNWSTYYRHIALTGTFSGILSAILTHGGTDAWGWPATIEYFDRYMLDFPGEPVGTSTNRVQVWEGAMYSTYRDLGKVDLNLIRPPSSLILIETSNN